MHRLRPCNSPRGQCQLTPGDDGNGDGEGDEDDDGLRPNLGQEAFAKMSMKLVKGHTNDEKPRTRESETLRFKAIEKTAL